MSRSAISWKVKKSDSSRISGSRPCLNRTRYLTAECCDSLVFLWNPVNFVGFSVIHVAEGSVATYVSRGGKSTQRCIANFLLSLSVKEFLKSVKIWQSYCQKFRGLVFLEHGVYCHIHCHYCLSQINISVFFIYGDIVTRWITFDCRVKLG